MEEVKCKRCDRRYSKIHRKCPYCGQKRTKGGSRLSQSDKNNNNWGKILGFVIIALIVAGAVYLAVPAIQKMINNPEASSQPTSQVSPSAGVSPLQSGDVTAPDISGTGQPAVTDDTASITAISLDKTDMTLFSAGETVQLALSAQPEGASFTAVWTSEDPSVATVSDSGLVTAVSSGTVNISVTVNNITKTCIVRVKISGSTTTGELTLNKTDITISVGEKASLTVAGASEGVTWLSDTPGVATVSDNGVVTGIARGTAVITVSYGNKTATCIVRVK